MSKVGTHFRVRRRKHHSPLFRSFLQVDALNYSEYTGLTFADSSALRFEAKLIMVMAYQIVDDGWRRGSYGYRVLEEVNFVTTQRYTLVLGHANHPCVWHQQVIGFIITLFLNAKVRF